MTGELGNKIDSLWEIFWNGGITNPLDVVEQMTWRNTAYAKFDGTIICERINMIRTAQKWPQNEQGYIYNQIRQELHKYVTIYLQCDNAFSVLIFSVLKNENRGDII